MEILLDSEPKTWKAALTVKNITRYLWKWIFCSSIWHRIYFCCRLTCHFDAQCQIEFIKFPMFCFVYIFEIWQNDYTITNYLYYEWNVKIKRAIYELLAYRYPFHTSTHTYVWCRKWVLIGANEVMRDGLDIKNWWLISSFFSLLFFLSSFFVSLMQAFGAESDHPNPAQGIYRLQKTQKNVSILTLIFMIKIVSFFCSQVENLMTTNDMMFRM